MRPVVVFGLALALNGVSPVRPVLRSEPTCEEECRAEHVSADERCERVRLAEGDRSFCHDAARARLDVCLRICDE